MLPVPMMVFTLLRDAADGSLSITVLYFEQARRYMCLNKCWVIFAVGAASAYFLYEDGSRLTQGNFLWGGYNSILLLVFASLLFLVKQHARE